MRDAIYLLQGISGTYIKFSQEENDDRIVFLDDPVSITLSELPHR